MTEDIVINLDKHDTDLFKRMNGKEGKLYVDIGFTETGVLSSMMKIYLDGTVSEDYVIVKQSTNGTYKLFTDGRLYEGLKRFGDLSYECELFCDDQFEGIGEKNLLLHLL